MKMTPIFMFMSILFVLLTLLHLSETSREPYIDRYCNEHGNCQACMKTSGCAWCPLARKCKLSSSIKSDENCNPDNAITALDKCESSEKESIDEPFDEPSSENAKSKPPSVYVTSEADYSHQTVMADVSKLRDELTHLQQELPDMIETTVQRRLHSAPFNRI